MQGQEVKWGGEGEEELSKPDSPISTRRVPEECQKGPTF